MKSSTQSNFVASIEMRKIYRIKDLKRIKKELSPNQKMVIYCGIITTESDSGASFTHRKVNLDREGDNGKYTPHAKPEEFEMKKKRAANQTGQSILEKSSQCYGSSCPVSPCIVCELLNALMECPTLIPPLNPIHYRYRHCTRKKTPCANTQDHY